MRKKKLSGTDKRLETLAVETEKQKKTLIIQLRRTPIVEFACGRAGVGRSTYYKWRAQDKIFARVADSALESGQFLINDAAESQLIRKIQDGDNTAIIFWLKHNHPKYSTRIIHEYDITCDRISTEEQHAGLQMLAGMASRKLRTASSEQIKSQVEDEDVDEEEQARTAKEMEKYDED